MLNYNDIVNELNSYSPLELVKLYNSCSEKEYKVYSYNDRAIIEFIEKVVRMEFIDFIGMVVMADTYSYDASRDNVFYIQRIWKRLCIVDSRHAYDRAGRYSIDDDVKTCNFCGKTWHKHIKMVEEGIADDNS